MEVLCPRRAGIAKPPETIARPKGKKIAASGTRLKEGLRGIKTLLESIDLP